MVETSATTVTSSKLSISSSRKILPMLILKLPLPMFKVFVTVLKPIYWISIKTSPNGILSISKIPFSLVIPPLMVSPRLFLIKIVTYGSGSLSISSITSPLIDPNFISFAFG